MKTICFAWTEPW